MISRKISISLRQLHTSGLFTFGQLFVDVFHTAAVAVCFLFLFLSLVRKFSWKWFHEKICSAISSNILSFGLLLVVVVVFVLFTNRKNHLFFLRKLFVFDFFCVKTTCILYKVILFQVQLENCVFHCSENEADVFSVWKNILGILKKILLRE